MSNGIEFGNVTGGGRPIAGANNGTSIDSNNFIVLGQTVSEPGNPGIITTNREIPYSTAQVIFKNLLAAGTDLRLGNVSGGRVTLKINGGNGGVATIWITNVNATTYKDWQWEATTADVGRLVLNDNVGNFFIMNRNLASISAPFHMFQKVLDTAVNLAMALTVQRSRHVITNRGAVGAIIISLPTIVASIIQWPEFTFTVVNANMITLQAPAGQTIRIGAVVSPVAGTVTSTAQGDSVRLQYLGNNEWQAIAVVGVWVTP